MQIIFLKDNRLLNPILNNIFITPTDKEEIINIIDTLKSSNSCGHDKRDN